MIKNLLGDDDAPNREETEPLEPSPPASGILSITDPGPDRDDDKRDSEPFVLSNAPPESFAETARKSGLAWSAGIAFFASVVFMLIIGWFADLLLGSAPWGIVFGIILGSLIGFVQFFRITSQIFKK